MTGLIFSKGIYNMYTLMWILSTRILLLWLCGTVEKAEGFIAVLFIWSVSISVDNAYW